jgi:transposase
MLEFFGSQYIENADINAAKNILAAGHSEHERRLRPEITASVEPAALFRSAR